MTLQELYKKLNHHKHQLTTLGFTLGYKGIKKDMEYHINLINLYQNKINRVLKS